MAYRPLYNQVGEDRKLLVVVASYNSYASAVTALLFKTTYTHAQWCHTRLITLPQFDLCFEIPDVRDKKLKSKLWEERRFGHETKLYEPTMWLL
jgi:hypothetical protein